MLWVCGSKVILSNKVSISLYFINASVCFPSPEKSSILFFFRRIKRYRRLSFFSNTGEIFLAFSIHPTLPAFHSCSPFTPRMAWRMCRGCLASQARPSTLLDRCRPFCSSWDRFSCLHRVHRLSSSRYWGNCCSRTTGESGTHPGSLLPP